MARYIDADKLLEELQEEIEFETTMYTEEQNKWFNIGLKCAVRDVKSQPTADVVEVVRCKDCQYRGDYGCPMYYEEDIEWDDDGYTEVDTIIHDLTTDYNFCSYGERKETEDV